MTTDGEAAGEGRCDVFISFARESGKPYALALQDALNSLNIDSFVDERDTPGGAAWDQRILNAQLRAPITVVVVSCETRSSPHQNSEIQRAIKWARQQSGLRLVLPWRCKTGPTEDFWPSGLSFYQGAAGGLDEPTAAATTLASYLKSLFDRGSSKRDADLGDEEARKAADREVIERARRAAREEIADALSDHPRIVQQLHGREGFQGLESVAYPEILLGFDAKSLVVLAIELRDGGVPSDDVGLRRLVAACLGVEAAAHPSSAAIRVAAEYRPPRPGREAIEPGRGVLAGIATPAAAGIINAAALGKVPSFHRKTVINPASGRAGAVATVEHTLIWSAAPELPVVTTAEVQQLRSLSMIADELNALPAVRNPAGLRAVGDVLDSAGAARAADHAAQLADALANLELDRDTRAAAWSMRMVVVWGDEWGAQADRAYEAACKELRVLFGELAPPVFLLYGGSHTGVADQRYISQALLRLFRS